MRAGNFDPMICGGCGHVETEYEREFDKDCKCGGCFVSRPYVFNEKPKAQSSTSAFIYAKGNIACQMCGCRDRKRASCQCDCHKGN